MYMYTCMCICVHADWRDRNLYMQMHSEWLGLLLCVITSHPLHSCLLPPLVYLHHYDVCVHGALYLLGYLIEGVGERERERERVCVCVCPSTVAVAYTMELDQQPPPRVEGTYLLCDNQTHYQVPISHHVPVHEMYMYYT